MTSSRRWPWLAALLVFPVTAILHHAIFFRPTCILNPFGPDYDWATITTWLRADPSLPYGIAVAGLTYLAGRLAPAVQPWLERAAAAFLLAFLPLTVWLWDIPGAGRVICHHFHDGRLGLHSRHLYVLGAVVFLGLLSVAWLRHVADEPITVPSR